MLSGEDGDSEALSSESAPPHWGWGLWPASCENGLPEIYQVTRTVLSKKKVTPEPFSDGKDVNRGAGAPGNF
jgi:hypothetical protein